MTTSTISLDDTVHTNRHGNWDDEPGVGVVRRISEDGRVIYVEEAGDEKPRRYSREEVR